MDLVGGSMNEEVLIEILKRLRVKCLLRFMCVSKLWCNLISDPYFVASHLRFNKKPSSSSPDFQVVLDRSDQDFEYFRMTQETLSEHIKFKFPWNPNWKPKVEPKYCKVKEAVSITGHCNGVVCARHSQTYRLTGVTYRKVSRFIICNPITRTFHILPDNEIDQSHVLTLDLTWNEKVEAVGFGFVGDVSYKVVVMIYFIGSLSTTKVCSRLFEPSWAEVYDSRSGSWRRVLVDTDFSYHRVSDGVYNPCDRCLYWIGTGFGKRRGCVKFVSFDLVEEKWCEILLPNENTISTYFNSDQIYDDSDSDEDREINDVCVSVKIVGESVIVFVEDCERELSVWKMNKEDDKVCWTLMHNLNINGSAIGFCSDGRHFLMTRFGDEKGKRLLVNDLEDIDDVCLGFADLGYRTTCTVVPDFVESLVLLDGERGISEDGCVRVVFPKSLESEQEFEGVSNLFEENL